MIRSVLPTEHQIQSGLIDWARITPYLQYGCSKVSDVLWAIPNGGLRNIVTATKLKREGTRKGIPDLFTPIKNYSLNSPCAWFEAKKPGGRLSNDQKEIIKLLNLLGHHVYVFYSVDEGIRSVKDYLGII